MAASAISIWTSSRHCDEYGGKHHEERVSEEKVPEEKFSESYGTRVAQLYAYVQPDSLHRLILIGVNTPGHFTWDRAVFDEMVAYRSDLCAQDAACSSRTGDLAGTIYAVNHEMPQRWLFFNGSPGSADIRRSGQQGGHAGPGQVWRVGERQRGQLDHGRADVRMDLASGAGMAD